MGNWWDVITSPIQQAVTNVQQTVSNIIAPPAQQPTVVSQGGSSGGSYGGGGAGYTNATINTGTNAVQGLPVQVYSSNVGAYVPTIQGIGNQVVSGIQNLPQSIGMGIQNLPQTIGGGIQSINQSFLGVTGIGAQGLPQTPQGMPLTPASVLGGGSQVNLPAGYGLNLVGGASYTPVMIDQYNTKNPAMLLPSYGFAGSTVTEQAQSKIPGGNFFGMQTPEINLSSMFPKSIGAATAFLYPGTTTTYSQQSTYASPVTTTEKSIVTQTDSGTLTEKFYNTVGGVQNEITRTQSSAPSGFDALQGKVSEKVYSGYGSLFGLSGDQAKTALSIVGTQTREMANVVPSLPNLQQSAGSAVFKYGMDKPLEAGVNFGIAVVTAGVFGLAEGGLMTGRTALAEGIIGTGQSARALELVSGTAMKYAPTIFAGVYGASVAERSTSGFSDFRPGNVTAKAAPIGVFEVAPMIYGFGVPAKANEAYLGIKEGYKAFQLEAAGARQASMVVDMEGNLVMTGGAVERSVPTFRDYVRAKAGEALDTSYVTSRGGLLTDISSAPNKAGRIVDTLRTTALDTVPAKASGSLELASSRLQRNVGKFFENPAISPEPTTIKTTTAFRKGMDQPTTLEYDITNQAYGTGKIAEPLTAQQNLYTELLRLQGKTGVMQPERLSYILTETGQPVTSYRGGFNSVSEKFSALEGGLKGAGYEPLNIKYDSAGLPNYYEYDLPAITTAHTHTRGLDVINERYLQNTVLSLQDIQTAMAGGNTEAMVSKGGAVLFKPRGTATAEEVYGRMISDVDKAYGSSKTTTPRDMSEAVAASLRRVGWEADFITTEEMQAALPKPQARSVSQIFNDITLGGNQPTSNPLVKGGELWSATEPVPRSPVRQTVADSLSDVYAKSEGSPKSLIDVLAERLSLKYSAYPEAEIARINANTEMGITQSMIESATRASASPFGKTISGTSVGMSYQGGTRMTGEKVVGGKQTSGLTREASSSPVRTDTSLRTTDVQTPAGRIGTRTDYRGRTEPMKPMDQSSLGYQGKQAAGASPMSELLPQVEGMTTGRVAPSQQNTLPFSISFLGIGAAQPTMVETMSRQQPVQSSTRSQLVQVLGADMPVTQEQQRRQESMVSPAFAIASGQKSDVIVSPISGVLSGSMQQSATQQMVATASTASTRESKWMQGVLSGQVVTPDVSRASRSESIITPITSQRITQTPITTTEIVPTRQTTIERGFVPIIPPPVIPLPGLPIPPFGGGGGAGGTKNQRLKKFTDIYRYGQGIGNFGGVNPIRFGSPGKAPVKHHKKK